MDLTLWHNPRCSKSRQTLELLTEHGHAPVVRHYLSDPPSRDELIAAADTLGVEPLGMIRRNEAIFRGFGLANAEKAALFDAMVAYPILIERPILFANGRAAIGRPPEAVLDILRGL